MLVETKPELQQYIKTWQGKKEPQVVGEIASYCLETRRIPDPYYFLLSAGGELFSPTASCRVKDVVVRNNHLGRLEYEALEKIEQWAACSDKGVIIWVSPPDSIVYPDNSKVIISEIEEQRGTKILFNRAIVLDIDQERCFKLAQDLVNFSANRPFLSSIDEIRSSPIVLGSQGIHWSYILEELVEDLSLKSVRLGEDKKAKEEALLHSQEIYRKLFMQSGATDKKTIISELARMNMLGDYSTSCPIIFGGPVALRKSDYWVFGNCRVCGRHNIDIGPCGVCRLCEEADTRKSLLNKMAA